MHPVAGARGGTLVTVYGAGFIGDDGDELPLWRGGRAGASLTAGQLECTSPLPAVVGYVSVEVSTNGQDYSSTGVHFEYQQPVAVRALEPSRGPIEGGTFVNVTGSGFSARAALLGYVWCRFNSTSVAAAWRSCDGAALHRAAACRGRDERRGDPERAAVHERRRALRV